MCLRLHRSNAGPLPDARHETCAHITSNMKCMRITCLLRSWFVQYHRRDEIIPARTKRSMATPNDHGDGISSRWQRRRRCSSSGIMKATTVGAAFSAGAVAAQVGACEICCLRGGSGNCFKDGSA
eukprot:TRINITY_DN3914_c1_g2_i1.p1 TRINITY_DN3914_c1_g2~~TRINITY_DN3914_c1_g2_i1.p1  ORF type:complete len:125 (+),score=11.36 TRINITY_DN3914_c1_g2_i1:972-1346(+)